MQGTFPRRLLAVVVVLAVVSGLAAAGEIHSTMRNVNAVMEAHGFRISPVDDIEAPPEATDLAPVQVYEIERPMDRPVTIGRLFTSCSCIQLETNKRNFRAGERAILYLRNIKPTPPQGQLYAIFVQITSPVRTTLRFDTFVQTGSGADESGEEGEVEEPEAGHNADAENHQDAGEAGDEGEVEGTASIVQDVIPVAAGDDIPATVRPPDLPSGTEVEETVLETIDEVENDEGPSGADAAVESGDAMEGVFGDLDDFFQQGDASPTLDTELSGEIPDFYSETQTMPIGPPADVADGMENAAQPAPSGAIAGLAPPAAIGAEIPPPAGTVSVAPPAPAVSVAPPTAPVAPPSTAPEPAVMPVHPSEASVMAEPVSEAPVPAATPLRDPNAKKPVQAVSLITIGVRDMPASIRFYEALGWRRAARGKYDQTAFFQLQGQILALYPINDQLQEQNMVGANPAPGGITLALHVSDKADVWAVYQRFVDAGGTELRPPAELPSGAVSSYVADPDGNPWEISWVPQFRIDDEGGLWLP